MIRDSKGNLLIEAKCYLLVEDDGYCKGVRFVLSTGESFGFRAYPYKKMFMTKIEDNKTDTIKEDFYHTA